MKKVNVITRHCQLHAFCLMRAERVATGTGTAAGTTGGKDRGSGIYRMDYLEDSRAPGKGR